MSRMTGLSGRIRIVLIAATSIFFFVATALNDGQAKTPVMGWNSYNTFGTDIDEQLMRSSADLLVHLGLATVGYTTLILDDGWPEANRTTDGYLVGSASRFPSGMKELGDYFHSQGLKFGIYSDAGAYTCAGWPGSRGYEEKDAQTWASWGVDYLKYDNCYAPAEDWVIDRYSTMRDALSKASRNIVYSLCDWGVLDPWLWADKVGHSWRTTQDIKPNWQSILSNLDGTVGLARYAGPGGWNDPDMLEVGVGTGLSLNEERAHFALWALLKAPLLIGADLRSIQPGSLRILKARELIAVNQDSLGVAGELIWKQGAKEIYAAPIHGGARAVVFLNRHIYSSQYYYSRITVHWDELGYPGNMSAVVRDLWEEKDIGVYNGSFTAHVDLHDGAAFSFTPIEQDSTALKAFDAWRPWRLNPSYSTHDEDLADLVPPDESIRIREVLSQV